MKLKRHNDLLLLPLFFPDVSSLHYSHVLKILPLLQYYCHKVTPSYSFPRWALRIEQENVVKCLFLFDVTGIGTSHTVIN